MGAGGEEVGTSTLAAGWLHPAVITRHSPFQRPPGIQPAKAASPGGAMPGHRSQTAGSDLGAEDSGLGVLLLPSGPVLALVTCHMYEWGWETASMETEEM